MHNTDPNQKVKRVNEAIEKALITIANDTDTASAVSSFITAPKIEMQGEKRQLFSNPMGGDAFGMSRGFTDKFTKLQSEVSLEAIKRDYKYNPSNTFITGKDKSRLALRVIDTQQQITTAEDLHKALLKIKSGKTLQTLLALWAFSNQQGDFRFNGTRLSEIMETVLKKPASGYFNQKEKRDFTAVIHILRDLEIWLDENVQELDDKGRKKDMVRRDYYRLVDIRGAVYAKDKDGKVDDSVIVKLYGELLPNFNKGIMRGRLYSRGLLWLDANKDERAILLGYKLQTRIDQIRQGRNGSNNAVVEERLYIDTTRKQLVEWGDYAKTDLINPTEANKQLANTLNKLVEVRVLRDYTPKKITTDNSLRIRLWPHPLVETLSVPEEEKGQLLGVST